MFRPRTPHGRGAPRSAVLILALAISSTRALAQRQTGTTEAERRVESLVAQMTLQEKITLIAGVNGFDLPALPRLGIPELGMADSPFGVRALGPSTLYAGGINLAATWNPELAERVGTEVGRDARARGKHYSLGPGLNIYRSPLNGRNFEYYGEDPFLASRIAVGYVKGMQTQGVSATVKHFMGNNSEFGRNTTDSRIDERALREIYLPAFEAAVKEAKAGAIMGSYNLTNGFYMTANRHLITDVVKNEWGFQGVYMSDWYAMHDGIASANAGTDLEMPEPQHFNQKTLGPAIQQGTVSQATIDDKVRRILRNDVRFGWLGAATRADSVPPPNYNTKGRDAALQAALEGMVLLRNERGALPLDPNRVKTIAIIGPNAHPAVALGGGSATIPPYHAVSVLEGIGNYLGSRADVFYARGVPSLARATLNTRFTTSALGDTAGIRTEVFSSPTPTGTPLVTRVDRYVALGAPLDLSMFSRDDAELDPRAYVGPYGPLSTRWTGFYHPQRAGTYDFVVQQGGFNVSGFRLYVDGKLQADRWTMSPSLVETIALPLDTGAHKVVFEYHGENGFFGPFVRLAIAREGDWVDAAAVETARRADAVVLAVGFDPQSEGENWDRTFRLPPGQDELIRRVAAANPRTIVVVNSGGSVDMREWLDSVAAVVEAWYPGQEGGVALAKLLFGEVSPSGHLPATFEKRWEDNPTYANYYPDFGTNRIWYREGVFLGYRGYEQKKTAPQFPFGYGLSYTTFAYRNLTIAPAASSSDAAPTWSVSFDVTNTGARAGSAVAQVYVHERAPRVPRPPKELKGFTKVTLNPGETKRVSVPLTLRSLAYYDVGGNQWRADAGTFDVLVGSSSDDRDIAARGELVLRRTVTSK